MLRDVCIFARIGPGALQQLPVVVGDTLSARTGREDLADP